MARKKENYYFNSFVEMVEFTCKAAEMIERVLNNFNYNNMKELKTQMHSIEHAADIRKHEVLEKLAKEFITPIEIEDIIQVTQTIDDVTDSIEDILLKLYMYNVKTIRQDAIVFSQIVYKCVIALKEVLVEFNNFKKPDKVNSLIVNVNHLEEEGDELYINAIRKLFVECKDPVELLIWEELFYCFEICCDACEDVADAIEAVIMKNA